MSAAILILGGCLGTAGQGLAGRWVPNGQPDVDQLLGAASTAAGLAVVAWWVLSMLCAFLAAVLERTGRHLGAATVGSFCPLFMRRLALGLLSVQMCSIPLANAAEPVSGPDWGPTQTVSVPAAWGSAATAAAGEFDDAASAFKDQQHPQSGAHWRPSSPITDPDFTVARPVRAGQGPPESPADVTVLAGDTLWDIAARDLGPAASDIDVALHWPRWYEANKAEIGENPDVLLPGQILKPPAAA
jgi:LysM repeat protein